MSACRNRRWLVQGHGRREVTAACDGGRVTAVGGGLLVRDVEESFGIVRSFVGCVTVHRDPVRIEESVQEVLVQRGRGPALGDEDLHDYDEWRHDPLEAASAVLRTASRIPPAPLVTISLALNPQQPHPSPQNSPATTPRGHMRVSRDPKWSPNRKTRT